ncbi:DUF6676 family protein [Corynebacterium sp.]|uniref:Rv1476 family membrane protein n=1 Tax=Corynebacterium sp. TaxID=1720 RepID=UPI002A919224|nr:DUF6676 family protein [Corynebacterium sp.]MDY5784535.1 DUF6676 family protein [Corynebacterium sp.]
MEGNGMIPADVDMAALEAQLRDDGIAFGTANPANEALEVHLQSASAVSEGAILQNAGIVVLEMTPEQPADLRDIAHDLADATGRDPVIVRTPQASGAVSETLTRHQVESAQRAMMAQPDYGEGLQAFASVASGGVTAWPLFFAAAVASVVVAAGATAALVKRWNLTI